ncbi:hypothetical protein [Kordiimonas sp. SCSIO 12610]|uniref:hypothetical protein n=1 Tax=Kordiimonas sp. SCSIO 12610 TaxID=2829597 RepID=UPI00210ACA71|nr:hypothetical protein [Kordiimonas sp. SCSIO 12610]UTW54399.1 hypothetical protein KFF44_11295 [Kordiimonas sp. SCSIO 12610]
MTKINFRIFIMFALAMIVTQPILAQGEYKRSYTAEKENGTFIAYLKGDPYQPARHSNDFIKNVEVGLKWTGFFGQPVESYTLRWTQTGSYRFADGKRLSRKALESYPDLMARYDAIKPLDIVLSFQVKAFSGPGVRGEPNNHYIPGDFASGLKEIRRTPHFVIARAGCRSSDIVPSSPRSHSEFIDWRSRTSVRDRDLASKNTLNAAKSMTFSNVFVREVRLPDHEFRSIYNEYLRRTAIPNDPVAAARKAEADAFWGNQRPQASGKRVVSVKQATPCKEPPRFAAKDEAFEIRYDFDSQLYSVVATDGRIMILPTKKRIISYKGGVARALDMHITKKQIICKDASVNRHGRSISPWVVGVLEVWGDGYINRSGKWISKLRPKAFLGQWDNHCTIPRSTSYNDRTPYQAVLAAVKDAKKLGADRVVFGVAHIKQSWHKAFEGNQDIVFGWPALDDLRGHSNDESYIKAYKRYQNLFEE